MSLFVDNVYDVEMLFFHFCAFVTVTCFELDVAAVYVM